MDGLLILTILIIFFSLAFDFINGFHDTANAIATSVSTKALRPRQAILLAAVMNFVGALTFTGVAQTVSKDIVDPFTLHNGSVVILAALISAILWNLLTWYYGIPSSSSHALIGGLVGAVWSYEVLNGDAPATALHDLLTSRGVEVTVRALLLSPLAGLLGGF